MRKELDDYRRIKLPAVQTVNQESKEGGLHISGCEVKVNTRNDSQDEHLKCF